MTSLPPVPLVSVCVPTYNGAAYLAQCLDSVLAQTCADFELLVVDDGSTDDSFAIAQRYAGLDARVRVERNPVNLGLTGNWERCFALARGEWIKFVFQDDLIEPDCLSAMIEPARAGHRLVACAREFIFESPAHGRTPEREGYEWHREFVDGVFANGPFLGPADYARMLLLHPGMNLVGEPTCVLMHRDLRSRFGPFQRDLISLCDAEYWNRVGVHCGVYRLPRALARFRVHADATSAHNIARRRFRNEHLDRLLVLHDFAFAPVYAPLREVAARAAPPVDLEELFWSRAMDARWQAKQPTPGVDPRYSPMREWREVSRRYPRMDAIPVPRLVRAKWSAVKQTLSNLIAAR